MATNRNKNKSTRAQDNSETILDDHDGIRWDCGCSLFNCCLCIPPVYGVLLLSITSIVNAVTQTFFQFSFSEEPVASSGGLLALLGACFLVGKAAVGYLAFKHNVKCARVFMWLEAADFTMCAYDCIQQVMNGTALNIRKDLQESGMLEQSGMPHVEIPDYFPRLVQGFQLIWSLGVRLTFLLCAIEYLRQLKAENAKKRRMAYGRVSQHDIEALI
eukprot:97243_1